MKDKYIDECKIIKQNCTYTSEAHHQKAKSLKRFLDWLTVLPAAIAAITSTFVASGIASTAFLPLGAISATIAAMTGALNPSKDYQEHFWAAKEFAALKHDARFLLDAQSTSMTDEAFAVAVGNLHNRYNDLMKNAPRTDDKAFEKARAVVQAGIHDPDRDQDGSVK